MARKPGQSAVAGSRSIGLVGHTGAGKTQLAEMLLHAAGVVRQPGAVSRGEALLAWDPDERRCGASLWPSWAWLPWKDAVVHVVDTPGGDGAGLATRLALVGADAAVLVLSAPDGVECGAEDELRRCRDEGRPVVAVVNKLDRPCDLPRLLERLGEVARRRVMLLQLPLTEGDTLVGVVDLVDQVALRYDPDGGGAFSREPVPAHLAGVVREAREHLLEAVALTDDELLEAYLERLDLLPEEVWAGLANAARRGVGLPVLLASAVRNVGAHPLLDALLRLVPDPVGWTPNQLVVAPRVVAQWVGTRLDPDGAPVAMLRVFRGELAEHATVVNPRTGTVTRLRRLYQVRGPRRAVARCLGPGSLVATWDLPPGRPGDTFVDGGSLVLPVPVPRPDMAWLLAEVPERRQDALRTALAVATLIEPGVSCTEEADGSVRLGADSLARLEAFARLLRTRFGLEVQTRLPPIPYMERPIAPVEGVRGLHRRVKGGEVAEFGEVWVDVEPAPPEFGIRFEGLVDDDVLPERFVPAVGEGAERALRHGPTAGYPVTGVFVRCTAGEYDALESREEHFRTAGEAAVRQALERVGTEVLEPWSDVEVSCPGPEVGAVLADLAARRGRVLGLEVQQDEITVIRAQMPERELQTLSARLEALTRGRGWFVSRRSHWDSLPGHLVSDAVASSPLRRTRSSVVAK